MKRKKTFSQEELRYLKLLAQQYPTVQAASSEIINLQAILNLPKGTEHFISVRRHHLQVGPGRGVHPHLLPGGQAGAAPRNI